MGVFGLILLRSLRKYRTFRPEEIVKCMVWVATNGYGQVRIESDKIRIISKNMDGFHMQME